LISVTDKQGNTLNLPYSLSVNPIGITTVDLPPAEVGAVAYSQQLNAAGGKPPYIWSLLDAASCFDIGQHPVLGGFPGNVIPTLRVYDPLYLRPAGDLTPEGRLTVQTPLHYDQTFCVQVIDSAGNKAKSSLTVISLEPGQLPLEAFFSSTVDEVSVGDPVSVTIDIYEGASSPYTATALSLPPGFVFYPDQRIVFGYPQTPGIDTVRIQVTDGTGATAIAETTFRVSPIRVGSASAKIPTYGKPFSQQFYAVNAVPMYSWALVPSAQLPAGLTFSSAGLLSGTPLEAGYFFPIGRITDALGNSRGFGLLYEVSAGTPDTLEINSDTPFLTLGRESSYALTVYGEAPYTWTITGALPPGMVEVDDPRGALTLWGVPSVSGSYPITVRVTGAKGNAGIRLIPLHVTPLHSDALKLPSIVAGVSAQIPLPVDGGSAPYTWSVVTGSTLPPGMTLSSSGVLSGSPSETGSFYFTVAVTDATSNTLTLRFTLQIDAIRILTPQSLPPIPLGMPFSLQLQAIGGAPGYTWTLQSPNCPLNGLTFNADGLLTGTPTSAGYILCGIVVADTQGHRAGSYFSFYLLGADAPLPSVFGKGFGEPIFGKVSVGSFFSIPLSIFFGVPPYSLAPGPGSDFPPGLGVNTVAINISALSGFPTKAGAYTFAIEVTDALGSKGAKRAYVTISPNHIVSTLPPGVYDQPYSFQLRTIEKQQSLLWTVAPTDRLPVGLKLTPGGLLTGIPAETGPFTFTVRANDTAAIVTLMIDSGSLNTYWARHALPIPADVGKPISNSLFARDGASFSLSTGSLPPGLVLSSGGEISGTPTTAGVYTFTVRLDGYGGFGIGVATIRVGVIQGQNRPLPSAITGEPFSAQLQGGTLAPGDSLPPGLTLSPDGTLAGTPTAAWFYQFSVVLSDSTGDSVTSTYTLEVLNSPPTTTE
jgi:hypothetical protein